LTPSTSRNFFKRFCAAGVLAMCLISALRHASRPKIAIRSKSPTVLGVKRTIPQISRILASARNPRAIGQIDQTDGWCPLLLFVILVRARWYERFRVSYARSDTQIDSASYYALIRALLRHVARVRKPVSGSKRCPQTSRRNTGATLTEISWPETLQWPSTLHTRSRQMTNKQRTPAVLIDLPDGGGVPRRWQGWRNLAEWFVSRRTVGDCFELQFWGARHDGGRKSNTLRARPRRKRLKSFCSCSGSTCPRRPTRSNCKGFFAPSQRTPDNRSRSETDLYGDWRCRRDPDRNRRWFLLEPRHRH